MILLAERQAGALSTTLTLQKLKDDASDVRLIASLRRVVVGQDQEGVEASTLIIDDVLDCGAAPGSPSERTTPKSQRLLLSVVADAIGGAGEDSRPFGKDGPTVRGVDDDVVRDRYYARIAEKAEPNEDAEKRAGRQRKSFNRAVKAGLDAKSAHGSQAKRQAPSVAPVTSGTGGTIWDMPIGICPVLSRFRRPCHGGTRWRKCPACPT